MTIRRKVIPIYASSAINARNVRQRLQRRRPALTARFARSAPITGVALARNFASIARIAHRIVGGAAGMRDMRLVPAAGAVRRRMGLILAQVRRSIDLDLARAARPPPDRRRPRVGILRDAGGAVDQATAAV